MLLLRLRIPILVSALLALALAGCGGGGSTADPATILGQTFANKRPISSGVLKLAIDVRGTSVQGLPSPFVFSLGGPFASNPAGKVPKFQFDLIVGTGARKLRLGAISTGKAGWVQIGNRAFALPDSAFAGLGQSAPAAKEPSSGGLSLTGLGVDPRRWLTDAKVEGDETLAGEQTVRVSSGVKVGLLLEDLGRLLGGAGKVGLGGVTGAFSAKQRSAIQAAVKSAHVDVWSGKDDHLLRRLRVSAVLKDGGRATIELALSRLNKPQPIGPPTNPRPLSELRSALTALASGGAGAGGATSPSTPSAPPAASKSYSDCIAAAGADLAAAQTCAGLLGSSG